MRYRSLAFLAFGLFSPAPSGITAPLFGRSLAVDSGKLCVGQPGGPRPRVHVFDEQTGSLLDTIQTASESLDAANNVLVVGSSGLPSGAATYLLSSPPVLLDSTGGGLFFADLGERVAINSTDDFAITRGLSTQTSNPSVLRLAGFSYTAGDVTVMDFSLARNAGKISDVAASDGQLLVSTLCPQNGVPTPPDPRVIALEPETGDKLYEIRHPELPAVPGSSNFGWRLAIDGSLAAVSDHTLDSGAAPDAGAVYLFDTTPVYPLLTEAPPYAFPNSFSPFSTTADFILRTAEQNAGDLYFLLASASGSAPGLTLDGVLVPLNFDGVTQYTLNQANTAVLQNTFGTFSSDVEEPSQAELPGLLLPGTVLEFAFLTVTVQPPESRS